MCSSMAEGGAPHQTGFTDDQMGTMDSGFSSLMPHSPESGMTDMDEHTIVRLSCFSTKAMKIRVFFG